MSDVGSWIKKARFDSVMSQGDLADKIGVSNGTVSRWERGLAAPRDEQLAQLRALFGSDNPTTDADAVAAPAERDDTAAWIHRQRATKGLSQNELARQIGVSRSLVAAWETGRAALADDHFNALVALFTKDPPDSGPPSTPAPKQPLDGGDSRPSPPVVETSSPKQGGHVQIQQAQPYYRAALSALRFIEHRAPTGRRFGPEADARWKGFCGHLKTADRLDLLIRDADAQWVGAFGARTVFAMDAVCEDDPFGPSWEPLDPVDAEELWRGELAAAAPTTVGDTLTQAAAAWELDTTAISVGTITATDTFLVAGPSAVVSLAAAFAEGTDLDWAEQVVVVASPPAHRQLAALAAALVNATRIGTLHTAQDQPAPLQGARLITSPDAADPDRELAQSLAGS